MMKAAGFKTGWPSSYGYWVVCVNIYSVLRARLHLQGRPINVFESKRNANASISFFDSYVILEAPHEERAVQKSRRQETKCARPW
jgi:hypothetical protein